MCMGILSACLSVHHEHIAYMEARKGCWISKRILVTVGLKLQVIGSNWVLGIEHRTSGKTAC